MNWHKKMTNLSLSPDYRLIPKEARADHETILAQCAVLENSGVFKHAGQWLDKDFPMFCQLTRQEVDMLMANGLAKFRKGNLIVKHYDFHGQQRCENNRKSAQKGGFSKAERYRIFMKNENEFLAIATANAKANTIAIAKANTIAIPVRPSVPDPSDPPRTDSRTKKSFSKRVFPLGKEKPFLSPYGSIERIQEAWPWQHSFNPRRVDKLLLKVGIENLDRIVAGMKRDTANSEWRRKNTNTTAGSYIRNRWWALEPKIAAPKNGTSNRKPAKKDPNRADQEIAELDELARDFSEAFPDEAFPGKEKAWKMVKTAKVEKLANAKS